MQYGKCMMLLSYVSVVSFAVVNDILIYFLKRNIFPPSCTASCSTMFALCPSRTPGGYLIYVQQYPTGQTRFKKIFLNNVCYQIRLSQLQ